MVAVLKEFKTDTKNTFQLTFTNEVLVYGGLAIPKLKEKKKKVFGRKNMDVTHFGTSHPIHQIFYAT